MKLDQIQKLVKAGKYFYYAHALLEAKKDGIEPEDVVTAVLSGDILVIIPTVYIPNRREWIKFRIRKSPTGKRK